MTKKVIETKNGWYMKNDKETVELDEIVGLVNTDEPTDSVQLKKEAQLSICEKRIMELEKKNEQLKQELQEFKEWEKWVGDVKREEVDRVFKMSIYEIAEAFEYYKNKIKELKGDEE